MTRTFSAAAAIVALLSGCEGAPQGDAPLPGQGKPGASGQAATPAGGGDVALTGAGATFPYPLYTKWISEYGKANKGIKINYQSIGSGGGIRQITEGTVDFGATDAPMSEEQLEKAKDILHIPTCIGSVVIAYNLEGVGPGLKLTQEAAAGIFLGTIKKWDDPIIAKENPEAKLPAKALASVHRSDGSGTTKVFVDWLSAVSPEWKKGPGTGTSVDWPGGLGAKGNEGVTGTLTSTPGSVGYVELAYAMQNKLNFAAIKNKAGKFVLPSLEATTAAGSGAAARMPEDMRISIVDAEGETAYPISGFTYILLHSKQKDAIKGKALVDFLSWAVHDGQKLTNDLHYATLPAPIVERVDKKLAAITGPDGKPLLAAK